jgi:hypothetical protein
MTREGVSPMPQIVAAVLIGAGIAAGVKWLAKEVSKATRFAPQDSARHQPVTASPRDLGTLEYDARTGVYRPGREARR